MRKKSFCHHWMNVSSCISDRTQKLPLCSAKTLIIFHTLKKKFEVICYHLTWHMLFQTNRFTSLFFCLPQFCINLSNLKSKSYLNTIPQPVKCPRSKRPTWLKKIKIALMQRRGLGDYHEETASLTSAIVVRIRVVVRVKV